MPKQEKIVYEMIRDRNKEKRILWEKRLRHLIPVSIIGYNKTLIIFNSNVNINVT